MACLSSGFESGCCLVGDWFGLRGRLGEWSWFEWWVCMGLVGHLVRLGGFCVCGLGLGVVCVVLVACEFCWWVFLL